MTKEPLIVAHRAGNNPERARSGFGRAHLIEADVHLHRGRVEVRHEKIFRPTSRLWERWFLLPSGTAVPILDDVLEAIGPDAGLLLDLKCFTGRAARRIRHVVGENRPLTVSTRSWWLLRQFRSRPNTVVLRSCASRRQLWLAMRLPGLGGRVGVVAHERVLDDETIRAIRASTPLLFTWGVQSVERGDRMAEAGVTGLIVDDLDLSWPGL